MHKHITRSEGISLNLLYDLGQRSKILSNTLSLKTAELLYPLDPISAVCLTLAVQRYGQNERSLFSFLTAKGEDSLACYKHRQGCLTRSTFLRGDCHISCFFHFFDNLFGYTSVRWR